MKSYWLTWSLMALAAVVLAFQLGRFVARTKPAAVDRAGDVWGEPWWRGR